MNKNKIEITEKNYLSPEELTALRHVVVEPIKFACRRIDIENTKDEAADLEKAYDNLYRQLMVPRIERLDGRSLCEWDNENNAVYVKRKDGKFQNYGYQKNGKLYLQFFEALYLLEQNRLQLEFNTLIVSIEQAYCLLLGESKSIKYNQYYVYACFSKSGYILIEHQNQNFDEFIQTTKESCIFQILENRLYRKPIPKNIEKSPIFKTIQNSMEDIKKSIRQQINLNNINDDATVSKVEMDELPSTTWQSMKNVRGIKRKKLNNEVNTKRYCETIQTMSSNSFIDILRDDPEYKNFQKIFEKLDIVKLQNYNQIYDENCHDFLISFDVYLPNDGFKRSVLKPPKFRLIVLETNQSFPTHAEITKCYHQQKYLVPILIVSMSESKQMQAYLYYFSM